MLPPTQFTIAFIYIQYIHIYVYIDNYLRDGREVNLVFMLCVGGKESPNASSFTNSVPMVAGTTISPRRLTLLCRNFPTRRHFRPSHHCSSHLHRQSWLPVRSLATRVNLTNRRLKNNWINEQSQVVVLLLFS